MCHKISWAKGRKLINENIALFWTLLGWGTACYVFWSSLGISWRMGCRWRRVLCVKWRICHRVRDCRLLFDERGRFENSESTSRILGGVEIRAPEIGSGPYISDENIVFVNTVSEDLSDFFTFGGSCCDNGKKYLLFQKHKKLKKKKHFQYIVFSVKD